MVLVDNGYYPRHRFSLGIIKYKGNYRKKCVKLKCSCGCNGNSSGILGSVIVDIFLKKKVWFEELNISEEDVSNQLTIHYDKLSHASINLLDISSLPSDLARQKWVKGPYLSIVRDSIATFCYLNNIGYWQGIHSIACALSYLNPPPNLEELSILLEKILLRFAPIIRYNKSSITIQCAKQISSLWNSLFQLFLPMTSAVFNDFCPTWNIDIFWTLGFHRFNCAYNCLYHWSFIIKCGNLLFNSTLKEIIPDDDFSKINLSHVLSFLYFELAQNLLRHVYWQKTYGLKSLIDNFSFDKRSYSIQDMMHLLCLCIQEEFSSNNQLSYPPDVFINQTDYHFDDFCVQNTNLCNYPMSLLITLVKSLYLLTPKFMIKCIYRFLSDLSILNSDIKGHVDNNFQVEDPPPEFPEYDYTKYINHFGVAKIELFEIVSYVQQTNLFQLNEAITLPNSAMVTSKFADYIFAHDEYQIINSIVPISTFNIISNFIERIDEFTPSKPLFTLLHNYYSSLDSKCSFQFDVIITTPADLSRKQSIAESARSSKEGIFTNPLAQRKGRGFLFRTRSRQKAISTRSASINDQCNFPFFYSTIFGKFVFIDLTNEFLLPKEFKGGKTIYYSDSCFHGYYKKINKVDEISDFKEFLSEIIPIRSPFGYTLDSTCWIIVTMCNEDCDNIYHTCYDGQLDNVTKFIQRELLYYGASCKFISFSCSSLPR